MGVGVEQQQPFYLFKRVWMGVGSNKADIVSILRGSGCE